MDLAVEPPSPTVFDTQPAVAGYKGVGYKEAVLIGQNFSQLRQGFLRAIFLITADQDNVFAGPCPGTALEDDAGIRRSGRRHQ